MGRSFGSRILQDVKEIFEPEDTLHDSVPENEMVTGAEPHPTEGDTKGVPAFPHPLPGAHEYQGKTVTRPERVPVPPNEPYYAGGMAHGVHSPVHYGGRIAPRHHERRDQESEHEPVPEIGHYKIEPIPVYLTEPGAGVHPLAQASFRQVTVTQNADPVRAVDRNPQRTRLLLLNESANAARMRTGPNNDVGALLPASMTAYRELKTQEEIYFVTDTTATGNSVISIIEEFKIARD